MAKVLSLAINLAKLRQLKQKGGTVSHVWSPAWKRAFLNSSQTNMIRFYDQRLGESGLFRIVEKSILETDKESTIRFTVMPQV